MPAVAPVYCSVPPSKTRFAAALLAGLASQISQRLDGRIAPGAHQCAAKEQAVAGIECEQPHRRLADLRQRNDASTLENEVFAPTIRARMKQSHEPPGRPM